MCRLPLVVVLIGRSGEGWQVSAPADTSNTMVVGSGCAILECDCATIAQAKESAVTASMKPAGWRLMLSPNHVNANIITVGWRLPSKLIIGSPPQHVMWTRRTRDTLH